MKKLVGGLMAIIGLMWAVWFVRQLQAGSDGAWMALGVGGTLVIYIVFSVVDLIKDRQRARWHQADMERGGLQTALRDLHQVSRVQGQALLNQQRAGRLMPSTDDLLDYGALEGDVLELPDFDHGDSNPWQ